MILLAFAFYGRRTKLGLLMELDVKLAPQCMEVGSAGLHTAAAAIQCRRGCQALDSGASVFGRYLEVVSDDFADQK